MNLFSFFTRKKSLPVSVSGRSNEFAQPNSTRVTETSALAISAVWASVSLLSGTISTLPISVYKTDKNGNRIVVKDHPLYSILRNDPNSEQTSVDFWEAMVVALEMRGNAYARKLLIGSKIVGLQPIFADVAVSRNKTTGQLVYKWQEDGIKHEETPDKILHIRGFGGNPLGGMSALSAVRPVFALAQTINQAATKTFENGMSPSGALTFETFLTPENRKQIKEAIRDEYYGAMNYGKPLVLEGGTKWQPFALNPEDAQMLQSRSWQVEEIARIFAVPPHMIGHTEKQTSWGTGVLAHTLGFQKFSLKRRLERIEKALMKQLLTPQDKAEGIIIEFNLEGLLRGSSQERAQFYEIMARNGFMTINQVRAYENWERLEGGDTARVQMQNIPIDQTGITANATQNP